MIYLLLQLTNKSGNSWLSVPVFFRLFDFILTRKKLTLQKCANANEKVREMLPHEIS